MFRFTHREIPRLPFAWSGSERALTPFLQDESFLNDSPEEYVARHELYYDQIREFDLPYCDMDTFFNWMHTTRSAHHKKLKEAERGYRYLLTFTLKEDFDDETIRLAEQWIHRNVVNPLHKPIAGHVWIAREKTQAGRDHWHVCGTYGISLKKNLFKYYEKKFGKIDFSRSKGEKEEITLGYLSKEEAPTLLN